MLQYLREVAGCSLSDTDTDGRTPLMLAAAGGHEAAVKYLLEQARWVPSATTRHRRAPAQSVGT